MRLVHCIVIAACWAGAARAGEHDIVFVAPTNHTMPMAQFTDGALSAGLLKDLGELIALRLGRHAVFLNTPSKRVAEMLASAAADAVCYVQPAWLDGDFNWSEAFIPNGGMVVARTDAPVVKAIADLADQPLGTVIGYRYPDFEAALGAHFLRADAPTMEHNIRKLVVGRMQYAIMEQTTFYYQMRRDPTLKLRGDLLYSSFETQCAFSRASSIPFEQVEHAIKSLIADGSVHALLAHYR